MIRFLLCILATLYPFTVRALTPAQNRTLAQQIVKACQREVDAAALAVNQAGSQFLGGPLDPPVYITNNVLVDYQRVSFPLPEAALLRLQQQLSAFEGRIAAYAAHGGVSEAWIAIRRLDLCGHRFFLTYSGAPQLAQPTQPLASRAGASQIAQPSQPAASSPAKGCSSVAPSCQTLQDGSTMEMYRDGMYLITRPNGSRERYEGGRLTEIWHNGVLKLVDSSRNPDRSPPSSEVPGFEARPSKSPEMKRPPGEDARHCIRFTNLGTGDAAIHGGNKVMTNTCSYTIEAFWCAIGPECDKDIGSTWTLGPNRSWQVSAKQDYRWGACRGPDSGAFLLGTFGIQYNCVQPLR